MISREFKYSDYTVKIRISSNMLLYAFGPVITGILSFITIPLLAKYFSVSDIGRYSMLQMVISFGVMLFSLQLHQSYVRDFYRIKNKNILNNAFFILTFIFVTISLSIIIIGQVDFSEYIYGVKSKTFQIITIMIVFFAVILNVYTHILRMMNNAKLFSLSQILPKLIFLVIIYILMDRFKLDSITNLVYSTFISFFFVFITFSFILKDLIKTALAVKFSVEISKEMLAFSLPLIASSIVFSLLTALDKILLKSLSSYTELGYYAVAISIASAINLLAISFNNIWHPTVYRWVEDGTLNKKINVITGLMLLAITLIWTFFGMFSSVIKNLFNSSYDNLDILVIGCISFPLISLLLEVTKIGISIKRKTSLILYTTLFILVINLILNYYFIPTIGAKGATLATIISFFVYFVILTECSATCWFDFKRFRLYLIVFILSGISMINLLYPIKGIGKYIIWLFVLLLSFLFTVTDLKRYKEIFNE